MVSVPFADDPTHRLRELVRSNRFHEALELHGRMAETEARPDVALLAATAATRLGELDRGRALADWALFRFRQRADGDGRMRSLNLLGVIAWERGQLEMAEEHWTAALAVAHELDDSLIAAHASNNLGLVAHLRGRPEAALMLFRGALVGYERIGDRRGTAQTWHNLALAFRYLGDRLEAERAAREAVRHAELVHDPSLVALAVTGYAEVHLEWRELELAATELERARRLADAAGDEIGVAEADRLLGRLALLRGDAAGAARLARAAREVAERVGSALLAAESAAVEALALRALGRAAEAGDRRAAAVEGFTRLGATELLARLEDEWHAGGADGDATPGNRSPD